VRETALQPLANPVFDYGHGQGCSITGGYIYRGRAIPALGGIYVFDDFCSGRVWGLFAEDNGYVARRLLDVYINISSFSESLDGNLRRQSGRRRRYLQAGAGRVGASA